jgi:4a-hydroxytetrahydrobiopterin dehydratase
VSGGGDPARPAPAGPGDRLDAGEVDARLEARHLDWRREGDQLVKEARLATFPDAIAWVGRVAELAEAADHHPDIDIRWRTVLLRLSTHSAGGLTEKDLALAAQIDGIGPTGS